MTPAARIQAAIEILDALNATAMPADRLLRDWFRARHFMGSKDRAAVAERVYDVLRHRGSAAWRMGREDTRSLVIGTLLKEGHGADEVGKLFASGGYGPAPLTDEELQSIATPPADPPPRHVPGEYPEWLEPELIHAFGDRLLDEMGAMLARAPVDLRVNSLRATRPDMLVGLRSLDIACEAMPFAPHGIRIPSGEGLGALQHTQFFQTGAFEFQDESSQIAALLCDAKPGSRVLDLAAGAGGKSLALAAIMQNQGEILAFDTDATRLKQLGPRARRAGATIITATDKRGGPLWDSGKFDYVLVDAPCSGSGAWRRNPGAKWRLTPTRLEELVALQNWLIDDGARHVKSGGRLIYATCSVLPRENQAVITAFLARNSGFRVLAAADIWRSVTASVPPPGMEDYFNATPHKTGTDGFFACIMTKV
ncbi:MAG TPA: RsmB/NOP family class I SAM-dependent RNA methyltransferase [Micropepsaceae bacterium]|nr:RsmB/NOP family class I SAM-dependent RNA methyltransferase [Micropepsaceae bacterium]